MASHKTGQELRVLTGTQDQVGNLVLMPDEMFHAIDTGARYIGAGPGGRPKGIVNFEMGPGGGVGLFCGAYNHRAIAQSVVDVAHSPHYPAACVSDDTYSGWSKIAGGGNSSVTASPVAGFAARLRTNSVPTGYVVAQKQVRPFVLSDTDVVSFVINVNHANNTRSIRMTLSNDQAGAVKAYIVGYQTWTPGSNTMSFKISDCVFAGGADKDTTWNFVQVDVTNPAYATALEVDVGPVWVGGAARVPLVCIGFDSGYDKVYDWVFPALKANGLVGNIYAMPSSVGQNNRMTLAKHKELYAAGWDIGLYVNVDFMGANNHTKDGICSAQIVNAGAFFSIDGTLASGGAVSLSPPRSLTAYIASGSESTNSYTVVGKDDNGVNVVEIFTGPSGAGTKAYTKNKFSEVTSVTATNATSVSVSIGTCFTGEEYLAEFALQKAWLDSNGFIRGWAHLAYALGEFNHESEQWVRAAGFKTARTVTTGSTLFRNQVQGVPCNEIFVSAAVGLGDPSSNTGIKTAMSNAITRGFDVFLLGHVGGGVPPNQQELESTIAWLGKLHRAGTIRVVSFSEYEAIKAL